jgi:peptide/nickel transport system substrate-binding protein
MKIAGILISLVALLVLSLLWVQHSGLAAEGAKKLMVVVPQEPTTLDQSLMSAGGDYPPGENWGEYLIYKGPNGDLRPGLVTSWKMSADGKEIDFALRKGVKFHSGDPLTTKDVQFSFERTFAKNPTHRTRLASIERFEIIDDYHFKIHFKSPDVTFIPNRGGSMIISKTYYDRVGEDRFLKNPAGTGPYRCVRHAPGEYIDVERFEDYWGEKPSVKEARFLFVPEDATRVAKLRAGEVDFISACPYPMVNDVAKSPGLKVVRLATNHPTMAVVFSNLNPKVPWHDKRVRLAMACAIDCDAIIKNILFGIPNRWVFLSPNELGYDPNLKHYPYDPKKAKELLAEAGFPKGFDLKFYWPATSRYPMPRETAEAIASYLDAVGIRTKLIAEEWAAFFSRLRASKGAEAEYVSLFGAGRSASADPSYSLALFFSREGGMSVYNSPELDKMIAEAKATVDNNRRAEVIKRAVNKTIDDVAMIPIFNSVAIYAMKNNIDFRPTEKINMDLVNLKDITVK